jgi:hypothetical protein
MGIVLASCVLAASSASAWAVAVAPGTGWEATSSVAPTNLPPGGTGEIQLDIINTGAQPSTGSLTVTDALPPGVTATAAGGMVEGLTTILSEEEEEEGTTRLEPGIRWACTGNGSGKANLTDATVVTCTSNPEHLPSLPVSTHSPIGGTQFGERIGIAVKVASDASGTSPNRITVAGGGATSTASASDPVTISSSQPGFGIPEWDVWFTNADGTPDTQAGSHPYEATFAMGLNELTHGTLAGGEVRNLEAVLPPGFFGDPNAVPQCTRSQLDGAECPAQTQIGIDAVGKARGSGGGPEALFTVPVYNMVPPPGVPDEFAFSVAGFHSIFQAGVRSGAGYGIVDHIENIPQVHLAEDILTLWGVPAEASHDAQRESITNGLEECREHGCSSGIIPKAFLTLPTSCGGPQEFGIRGLGTWTDPGATAEASVLTHDSSDTPAGFTGCEQLSVDPSLSAVPDSSFADTPAGLTADVTVPQETLTEPDGLVAATLKNTKVTLPEGLVINPGQAAGLVACQGPEANVHGEGPQSCPAASKVGTVKIRTPLLEGELENELEGNVYVLQSNPPNLQLLVAASADGIFLKLVGDVHLNESTGQLETTFTETPALPFTDFKLSFTGGAQAALATPTQCGSYTTSSDFTPWTTPIGADVLGSDSFQITSGPLGAPCPPSPLPFSPSMIAGSTTDQAGGFTNFSLLLQRADGQQRIEKLQFKEPAGLAGLISSVPLCDEANANAGTCSAASHIGHAVVTSGPGPYPLVLPQPGAPELPIYLTGPYKGAPFGLSIVTPVVAGPFNLGTVITRAKIEVDPHTAQLTITTDALPQIVKGVPTDLRSINSIIDRPNFLFNPTNCTPAEFTGTATSAGGAATAPLSSHFGVGSCRELEFHPKVAASTGAKASKANGASLSFNISYPKGALGRESWFNEAKFVIPKQLPARLTTLQKACLASVFESNPAACPSASVIGHATVRTPVLPVPLQGPVYFVSYGGAAFPNVVLLLQGYGVTVDLVGETLIKNGVTSATFRNTPDVPFENIEVSIPTGRFSEFGANLPHESYNFCGQKLVVPTLFKAQNGLEIHQNTPVAVTGCPPAVSISKTAMKANSLLVTVKLGETGTVKITGKGLKTTTKKGLKAGAHTITVPLTATGRAAKRHKGKLKVQAALTVSGHTGTAIATIKA